MTSNPRGEIYIQKIDTNHQLADIMTKGLVEAKFTPLRDRLMGWDLYDPAQEDIANFHSRWSVADMAQGKHNQSVPQHDANCD